MTQPAKVQEPSMEEILASIRRIIADDEAKPPPAERAPGPVAVPEPPKAEKPAPPPARPAAMTDIPPSKIAPAAPAKAAPPHPAPPPPTPAASNNQDDIDALLSGLDEATSPEEIRPPQPEAEVFELTDEMAVPSVAPPQPSFQRVEPQDDIEFTKSAASRAINRQPAYDPPSFEAPSQPILSQSTVSAGRIGLQHARPHGAQQQRPHAGGSGQGNAPADAEIMARRQPARNGRADRESRDRAGFPRAIGIARADTGPDSAITSGFEAAFDPPSVSTWC